MPVKNKDLYEALNELAHRHRRDLEKDERLREAQRDAEYAHAAFRDARDWAIDAIRRLSDEERRELDAMEIQTGTVLFILDTGVTPAGAAIDIAVRAANDRIPLDTLKDED